MKSFICVLLCSCLVVSLRAAAVEPVVEELKTDVNPSEPAVTATSESELMTNEDCHQPKETGRCFALFYRFAYDVEKRECVEFIYGGCAGNSNNFDSKEDCEVKCMKKSEEMNDAAPVDAADVATDLTTTAVPEKAEESEVSTAMPAVATEESVSS